MPHKRDNLDLGANLMGTMKQGTKGAPAPCENPYSGGFGAHAWGVGYGRGYADAEAGLTAAPGRKEMGLIGGKAVKAEYEGYHAGYRQFGKERVYLEG